MNMGVLVKQRGNDWWIFINHQGRRKAKKIGRDKALALDVAKKMEAKLALGELDLEEAKPFSEYADRWIKTVVPTNCKPSTVKSYQELLNQHVLPVFEKKPVDQINRMMVKTFLLGKVKDGYSVSTMKHMKAVISGVLNMAMDDNAIPANPAHRLGKMAMEKPVNETADFLTREELQSLLESFRNHFPRHYPMALTLARTGMRLGEVVALQWGDIDFKGRFIKVQRSFSLNTIQRPKSGKARKVDLSRQLGDTLHDLRTARKAETLKKGWKEVPAWVFVGETGNTVDPDKWRRRFDKALEYAGLRKIRIHDLRHTFASLLIQNNEPLPYVRDQLGHHSIKITVDIYGHLAPTGNKAAVDRLDDENLVAPGLHISTKTRN